MTRKKMIQKRGGSRRVEKSAKGSAKSKKASKPKPEGEKNVNE